MIRQRRVNISHEFTTGMADAINQFTHQQNEALEEQRTKYHKYVKQLRKDLDVHSDTVAKQASQIEAQTGDIQSLEESNKQLTGQLHDLTAKLDESSDRARNLKEKYTIFKAHYNSAILEQQELYQRSKKKCEDTLEEMRRMQTSQSFDAGKAVEEAVRNAEVIREDMIAKVRQAVAQNKTEAAERECCDLSVTHQDKLTLCSVYGKIKDLTQQVAEKDSELSQERESACALAQQLQDLRATSSSFEALASQGNEILTKLSEQQEKADEEHRKSTDDIRSR